MKPDVVTKLVKAYLNKLWDKRGSPNNFKYFFFKLFFMSFLIKINIYRFIPSQGGHPWISDFNHPHYQAAFRALKNGKQFAKAF